ncbi:MAG TPA: DUF6755 family protein [Gemmataceae bacterium]|nr:DUF6755 family protein [Gemmataceae bacterium]
MYPRFARAQRNAVLNAILCLALILAVLQLWLLTATVNACQGGDGTIVWPAAAASFVCAALNYPLFRCLRSAEGPAGAA